MAAKLIKGAEVAKEIREELKQEVEELKAKHKVEPGLVTILVGEGSYHGIRNWPAPPTMHWACAFSCWAPPALTRS